MEADKRTIVMTMTTTIVKIVTIMATTLTTPTLTTPTMTTTPLKVMTSMTTPMMTIATKTMISDNCLGTQVARPLSKWTMTTMTSLPTMRR